MKIAFWLDKRWPKFGIASVLIDNKWHAVHSLRSTVYIEVNIFEFGRIKLRFSNGQLLCTAQTVSSKEKLAERNICNFTRSINGYLLPANLATTHQQKNNPNSAFGYFRDKKYTTSAQKEKITVNKIHARPTNVSLQNLLQKMYISGCRAEDSQKIFRRPCEEIQA